MMFHVTEFGTIGSEVQIRIGPSLPLNISPCDMISIASVILPYSKTRNLCIAWLGAVFQPDGHGGYVLFFFFFFLPFAL